MSTTAPLTRDGHEVLFPALPYDIHERADLAAGDTTLQAAVERATLAKHRGRQRVLHDAFAERTDDVRQLAGRIKQHTLDHLDHYLERFERNATAAGAHVHFAPDAAQANAICLDIARRNHCQLCVKSKSMVTEETQLVPALESIGVQTIETDLGEFVVQLDHDAPSHIVTPIIHKNRQAVAEAFVRELGATYTEDAEALTMIARKHLRAKFRQADLGISGGNFLVADTGSLVICTNEGNGRLCTSVPRIHVAFVGIEKLVPSLEHLGVMLKVLARSSTAQPLTCYTHMITGPRRDTEPDGPEQVHIILVDNGRTGALADESREMLRCIRCGACLNACPVYRKISGHSYGSVYSGPIGAILTPMLRGLANYPDLPNASSLCGACFDACPVKIDIPKHLIRLREQAVDDRLPAWGERMLYRLWGWSMRRPMRYRFTGWMQRHGMRLYGDKEGWIRNVPGPLQGWTRQRDLPTPAANNFRHWWRHRENRGDRP